MIGMLDLPNLLMAKTAFPRLERELSNYIIPYTKELIRSNVLKELKLYTKKNPDFLHEDWLVQYKERPSIIDVKLLPLLTVGYDMAWQK
jgi:hypothetical protein